jgi:hypothetical protein
VKRAARPRPWALAGDEVDQRIGPEHGGDARLQQPAEAIVDPATCLWRRLDQQATAGERPCAQGLEPDAVGGLVDGESKLCLHA